jgi:hypothetical protein
MRVHPKKALIKEQDLGIGIMAPAVTEFLFRMW